VATQYCPNRHTESAEPDLENQRFPPGGHRRPPRPTGRRSVVGSARIPLHLRQSPRLAAV